MVKVQQQKLVTIPASGGGNSQNLLSFLGGGIVRSNRKTSVQNHLKNGLHPFQNAKYTVSFTCKPDENKYSATPSLTLKFTASNRLIGEKRLIRC